MTTTAPDDQDRECTLGALAHLVTFEEIDDAVATIERVLEIFEATRITRPPYYAQLADPDAGSVARLESAITELHTARSLHALPEAALEAALAAAGHPLEHDDDEHQPETRQATP